MAFKKYLAALVFAFPFTLGSPGSPLGSCDFLEPIKDDLIQNLFDNECGDAAHGALRISFHDAMGILPLGGGGGADGSILIFNKTELMDSANVGIEEVVEEVGPFYQKYANAISPGDFIQFIAAISLSLCSGAPRVPFSMGRPQPIEPAPPFSVPQPFNTTDELLDRFAELGFSPEELIALLASHTVAGAFGGIPFDSTPTLFDTNMFVEILLNGTQFPPGKNNKTGVVGTAITGTVRLQSDFELARDPRTACFWQAFALNHGLMTSKFAAAFFKMGLLGQANNKNLTDCSSVIPQPPPLYNKIEFPPQEFLKDIDQSCDKLKFPNLTTAPGPSLNVSKIPQV